MRSTRVFKDGTVDVTPEFWACDLEATVAPEGTRVTERKGLETEAYVVQARNVDTDKVHTFWSMSMFMDWVLTLNNANLYFHNLSGYDGPFILWDLLNRGYTHYIPQHGGLNLRTAGKEVHNYFQGDTRSFTVFTNASAENYERHAERVVNFIDTLPLMTTSIRKLGETIPGDLGKGDETPLVIHGDALHETKHKVRDREGNLHETNTYWTRAELLEYLDRDTMVLAESMRQFRVPECTCNGIFTLAKLAYETAYARLHYDPPKGGNTVSNLHNLIRESGALKLERDAFRPVHPGMPLRTPGETSTKGFKITKPQYRKTQQAFRQKRLPKPVGVIYNGRPVMFRKDNGSLPDHDLRKIFFDAENERGESMTLEDLSTLDEYELDHAFPFTYRQFMGKVNKIVKDGYKGGFTCVNPIYARKVMHGGYNLDVNSMYPAIYSRRNLFATVRELTVLPGDEPQHWTTDDLRHALDTRGPFYVRFSHMVARARPGVPPVIKPRSDDEFNAHVMNPWTVRTYMTEDGAAYCKWHPGAPERSEMDPAGSKAARYSEHVDGRITLSGVELAWMLDHYDISEMQVSAVVEYDDTDQAADVLSTIFAEHGKHWAEVKAQAPKGSFTYLYAKLIRNTPYGKLGQSSRAYPVVAYTADGFAQTLDEHDDGGRLDAEVGCAGWITAQGRIQIADEIMAVGMVDWCYSDTDSSHNRGEFDGERLASLALDVHPTNDGAWDHECDWDTAVYIQAKTYGESVLDTRTGAYEWESITAGFTRQISQERFINAAQHGITITDVRACHVQGGVMLLDVPMEIGRAAMTSREFTSALDDVGERRRRVRAVFQ